MSEKTLGKARGLNSIADPADFKGRRGRRGQTKQPAEVAPPPPPPPSIEDSQPAPVVVADATPAPTEAAPAAPRPAAPVAEKPAAAAAEPTPGTPHRAVVPGIQRKRREMSIPVPVAEALAATGINPADVVMSAYRTHGDAIFAGAGGRLVSRGRQRLRLSISDTEFDKLTRLGEARGWNRSETVSVLLTMDLLQTAVAPASPHD